MLFAEAEAVRPEIRRAAATRALADAGRRQARAALIPQMRRRPASTSAARSFNDRASSWLVGGELRWTFSLGGAERARPTRRPRPAHARAPSRRGAGGRAGRSGQRAAPSRVGACAAGGRRAAVDQARESQRIIRDRFDAGIAGVNDVLRASTAVLDADTQRVSALVDALSSDAMLRRALGRTQCADGLRDVCRRG